MKTRSGFVSNSSSSSFIVISNLGNRETIHSFKDIPLNIDGGWGESEFGWGPDDYYDVWSKINWCILIANEDETKLEMLKSVIKENSGASEVNFINGKYGFDGYIDHQSMGYESPGNLEMYNSEEELKDFLFNSRSYIHTDNDNH